MPPLREATGVNTPGDTLDVPRGLHLDTFIHGAEVRDKGSLRGLNHEARAYRLPGVIRGGTLGDALQEFGLLSPILH